MKISPINFITIVLFFNFTLSPTFAGDSNDNIQFKVHQSISQPAASVEDRSPENSPEEESSRNLDAEISLNQSSESETGPAIEPKLYSEISNNKESDNTESSSINHEEEKTVLTTPETKSVPKVLEGKVSYTVPSGTPIKLKLASVPSHVIRLMDRDFDGNLYPARLGQVITAKTTEDIYVGENKVIPEGSVFAGKVTKILPQRRLGRPGSLVLSFDDLTTPDGRKFAFRAQANNFKKSTMKTKAKGFGIIAYHAAGGAIVGALVAYEIFGLDKTIAMHGYNIAAGAAGGALIATGFAIMRKGPKASLEPGDDLNMTIDDDLLMPAALPPPKKNQLAELSNKEVTIEIEKSKIINDSVGGKFITVDATATNDSDRDLSSIDLFLEDTNSDRHPVCSSPDENSEFLFHLEPHSRQHLHLSFLTPYPKLKQELVWLDHDTKAVLARQKLK